MGLVLLIPALLLPLAYLEEMKYMPAEVIDLIKKLEHQNATEQGNTKPWAIVASFVNPHDIAIYGAITRHLPSFNFGNR